MAKKDTEIRKVGGTRSFLLTARSARSLVDTGRYEYAGAPVAPKKVPPVVPAPVVPTEEPDAESTDEPTDELDALTYWQLRKKADEAGLEVEGRTKADYLAALRGSYLRRDMVAE